MRLGKIATIRTGLILARKKASIKYQTKKTYQLLTLNNIEEDGSFNQEPFEVFFSTDLLSKNHFTEKGDILIRLSQPYTAVCIDQARAGLLVPSYFSIIKLTDPNFLPEYIAWSLNTEKTKNQLIRYQTGTIMATTNNAALASLKIRPLPLTKQRAISQVQNLYFKEKNLLNQLFQEKERYYKGIAQKLLSQD